MAARRERRTSTGHGVGSFAGSRTWNNRPPRSRQKLDSSHASSTKRALRGRRPASKIFSSAPSCMARLSSSQRRRRFFGRSARRGRACNRFLRQSYKTQFPSAEVCLRTCSVSTASFCIWSQATMSGQIMWSCSGRHTRCDPILLRFRDGSCSPNRWSGWRMCLSIRSTTSDFRVPWAGGGCWGCRCSAKAIRSA